RLETREEVLSFLLRWLVSHILVDDRRLAKAVLALEAEVPPDDVAGPPQLGAPQADLAPLLELIEDLYQRHARSKLALSRELTDNRRAAAALSRQRHYREFILRLAMSFINLP
ncbi:hypothetical protein V6O07_17215, partial [Arthrospira platensis SPKY2]